VPPPVSRLLAKLPAELQIQFLSDGPSDSRFLAVSLVNISSISRGKLEVPSSHLASGYTRVGPKAHASIFEREASCCVCPDEKVNV
jgi:hypothetical protein